MLCIGETLAQFGKPVPPTRWSRPSSKAVIDRCGIASFENAVIAYEPVWAIGTGKTRHPEIAPGRACSHPSISGRFDAAVAA